MENKDNIQIVCDYLFEIEDIMRELEIEINNLYVCQPDDIALSVEKINEYRNYTDELFEEVYKICDEDETGNLRKAVKAVCDRKEIDDDFCNVYEAGQEINAVAYRIVNLIPRVSDRLTRQKEKTLQEIKDNNGSQSAHASKYYAAVNNDLNNYHFSRKSRSI
ncbi:MAG: hypothetical protein E7510_08425 [Ruminococcus sp.]|nr:hypothetical protein [Ruminococcus sp.]